MSLLSIVQEATLLCGLAAESSPTAVMNSTDPNIREMRALAQLEGDILARADSWRGLKVLGTLTGDGTSTTFDLPTDFHRFASGAVFWLDESPELPLAMVTSDEMLSLKASGIEPVDPVWRIFGDQIEFYPAPENGEIINTEYRSKYWIIDNDGTTRKAAWAVDTDYTAIPERLITLGVIWRWRKMKGLDYDEDFRTYRMEMLVESGNQQGRQTISMRTDFPEDVSRQGRPAYYRINT
jgi:hypothetical protein